MIDYCPSKDWDTYCEQQERAECPADEELIAHLDAYGHLSWVVGFSDEWPEPGDNVCGCPTIWRPNQPVEKPEYDDGACTSCGGRENRGDWLACFDFKAHEHPARGWLLAYHVIINSDSGGFVETVESAVVPLADAPLNLPDEYTDIGMQQGEQWTEKEIHEANEANERWNAAITAAKKEHL